MDISRIRGRTSFVPTAATKGAGLTGQGCHASASLSERMSNPARQIARGAGIYRFPARNEASLSAATAAVRRSSRSEGPFLLPFIASSGTSPCEDKEFVDFFGTVTRDRIPETGSALFYFL